MCNYVDHPSLPYKYRFGRGVPDHTHIYNILHDYRMITRVAIGMRSGKYPLHTIQPYHNFRELTLFEVLHNKLRL